VLSPGVSTVTSIMLEIVEKAFPELINSSEGKEKLKQIVTFNKTEVTKELFDEQLVKSRISLGL
jgi:malate dehydrogenase (quinone)